ncbi:hypothetical protein BHE74_00019316 [Ensete ventricosum]|nr:hypothetical protein BHE74_00019316 [Ensete ventricosum]
MSFWHPASTVEISRCHLSPVSPAAVRQKQSTFASASSAAGSRPPHQCRRRLLPLELIPHNSSSLIPHPPELPSSFAVSKRAANCCHQQNSSSRAPRLHRESSETISIRLLIGGSDFETIELDEQGHRGGNIYHFLLSAELTESKVTFLKDRQRHQESLELQAQKISTWESLIPPKGNLVNNN